MTPEAINAADKNGNTALHAAILGGYKEVCELLISEMNPRKLLLSQTIMVKTALHRATYGGTQRSM